VERMKGATRVEFVCGGRALRLARRDFRLLSDAAQTLSAAAETLPQLIAKQSQELREAARGREKLLERLADYQAQEYRRAASVVGGRRVVRQAFPAEAAAEVKLLAHALAKLPATVALLGIREKPAKLFFAQSAGGTPPLGGLLKQTLAKFGGKGGGGADFAQGGGLEESRLEEALAYAEALLGKGEATGS